MRTFMQTLCALSILVAVTPGCSKKSETDAGVGPEAAGAEGSGEGQAPLAQVGTAEGEAPLAQAIAPPFLVAARPFDVTKYPGTPPRGEVLGGIAFEDSAGENFVIFTRDSKERDDHIYEATLHIHHVAKLNDEVRTVRTYVERVADCEFDVILNPFFGEWSVTDVDQDGVGEASFAYRVACVSDISPIGHKAFVTEGGEKYVLRGLSRLEFPGMEPEGGTYTADPMSDVFLVKAKEVWEATVALPNHE